MKSRTKTVKMSYNLAMCIKNLSLLAENKVSENIMLELAYKHAMINIVFKIHQRTMFVDEQVSLPMSNSEACFFIQLALFIMETETLQPFEHNELQTIINELHKELI